MTIHKAKGLGFPVAIVLLYEEIPRGFKYIVNEETKGVHLLKINQQIMKASSFLQEKYEEERLKDLVNKLNTLYVGFTRAEDELYIVGVQGKRNQFPIDLLQNMDSRIGSKNAPRLRPSEPVQVEKSRNDYRTDTRPREDLKLYHHPGPIQFPFAPLESLAIHGGDDISYREGRVRAPSSLTGFAAIEELNLEERLRGEFIHRVLYFVDRLDQRIEQELERIITRVNDELKTDYPTETMKKNLLEFLNDEEIKPYFQTMPGRVIKTEQEFSDPRGNLFRMDRVVFDEDQVSVIDYKTGTDKKAEKEYLSQLKNYIRILKEIYPDKKVEGIIAYVDLKEITLLR